MALGPLIALPVTNASDESRNFRFEHGRGVVGFISPVSEPYCGGCNRMRLTADGRFHLCLLNDDEMDVKKAIRSGGGVEAVAAILGKAVASKRLLTCQRPMPHSNGGERSQSIMVEAFRMVRL